MGLQCAEEAHRPVDCDTVSKWVLKNSAESENMNWYIDLSDRVDIYTDAQDVCDVVLDLKRALIVFNSWVLYIVLVVMATILHSQREPNRCCIYRMLEESLFAFFSFIF